MKTIELKFKEQEDYNSFYREIVDFLRAKDTEITEDEDTVKITINKLPK